MTAFDRFLDQLEGVQRRGNTASARCPAHDDRKASLSVSHARDFHGVVLHCHVGCTTEDIVAAAD